MAKLFVGGLPAHIDEDELEIIFGGHGDVVACKIVSDHCGGSRGYGFVTMQTPEQAARAIRELNGTQIQGRVLTVAVAHRETQASSKTGRI